MINKELQAELRAKYNPDGSQLRRLQLTMLEMLKYIDNICQENNIKYWLSSGSCLGAVRHGGFIPWDDDVDIELLDDDYNRLIDYLRKNETDTYVVQTHKDDPNYIHDFGKLRNKKTTINEVFGIDKAYKHKGVFIDIFRMSPSNSQKIHYLCGRLRVMEVYCKKWSIDSNFGKFLFPLVRGCNNAILSVFRIIDRIGAGDRLRHSIGVCFLKPRYYKDVESVIRVPFEGYELPIPKGYDHYLRNLFGNYLELKRAHSHIKN